MNGKPKEKRQLRLIYLSLRPDLWEHLPEPINPPFGCGHDLFMRWVSWKRRYNGPIIKAMKADGLIAPTTAPGDCNIPGLIIELKRNPLKLWQPN